MDNQSLTAIEGIRVGHAQNFDACTGCTVILCPEGSVAGVDQRGGCARHTRNRFIESAEHGRNGA